MEMISASAQFMFQALHPDPTLRTEIPRLRAVLPLSRLLIERCECWRFKYKDTIGLLLPQIKDAAYEAHSLLDEFSYQELKDRVEGPHRSFPGEFVSTYLKIFRNWMKGYTTRVSEIRENLDYLCTKLKEACDVLGIPENPNQFSKTARPVTSSFVTEPKIFGRDNELNDVIRLLGVSSGSSNGSVGRKRAKKEKGVDVPETSGVEKKENVSVLPIVGIGGVGKTTLAQMVYNNQNVKSHFELIIWVCVLDNFDVERLTKEIIECATKKACDIDNLNSLQLDLKETVKAKRFLLVLDDVWSESRSDWNRLFGPLKEGCEGSNVIVTTRSRKVAEITSTVKNGPINLEGLEEGVYWEFFRSCAFGLDTNPNDYPGLEEIGKQIVVKLKGSPLAARTLGSLLSADLDERNWRNIRDSEMWELQQEEHGILPVLHLSYQYLPSNLKKLFSFCSLFPKDCTFSEIQLIKFWIIEGFIDPQQKQQMEVVAKGYIRDLVSRCFFQKVPTYSLEKYVMHDLMHDVAQSVTKDECFRIENEDFGKRVPENLRHLLIECELKLNKLMELCKYKKLHSIIVQKFDMRGFKAIESWFSEFKNVYSLCLANCNIKKLPENIGNLRHLRFFDISHTKIEQLPNSFCNLYKLEFLNMEHCDDFQLFPEGSNRLISMKMLLLPTSKLSLIGHIQNLANAIQRLVFTVGKEEGSTIGVLKHMNRICGNMIIYDLDNVSGKNEAEQAQLNDKEFVDSLDLVWNSNHPSSTKNETHTEVLEGLCPHSNLKRLEISYYIGEILPSWLRMDILPNLTVIVISRCYQIIYIPNCLPSSITELTIESCWGLLSLQNCLVPSNLPSLRKISIIGCNELVSMPVETFHDFVSLRELIIYSCHKLTCQMVLPPSLQELHLNSCGELEEQLSSSLRNLTSLTKLTIGSCPTIKCPNDQMVLPPSLQELHLESCSELEERLPSSLRKLTSLTRFSINYCHRLTSIPPHVTSELKSLEYLRVSNCKDLQSIGGRKFLESVKEVHIEGCPKLKETEGNDYIRRSREIEEQSGSTGLFLRFTGLKYR